jgi:hypothetical protein
VTFKDLAYLWYDCVTNRGAASLWDFCPHIPIKRSIRHARTVGALVMVPNQNKAGDLCNCAGALAVAAMFPFTINPYLLTCGSIGTYAGEA